MHSQVQRGISLIIRPLPSERAGERLLFPIPSSQTHRGISLIVLPLPSERAGERLLFPHFVLSNTTGYLAYYSLSLRRGLGRGCFFLTPSSLNTPGNPANCSPSPFGEGWGEAVSGVFQAAFLWTIRKESVHIAPLSPPINEKGGRASLRDLHRNLVSNYYKIVISKVGFLSIQATSLSRQSLCLQQRERCCASAESLNSLGIVHHIIDT